MGMKLRGMFNDSAASKYGFGVVIGCPLKVSSTEETCLSGPTKESKTHTLLT